MVKRSKQSRAALPPRDREPDPYRVSAAELAPRRKPDRAYAGAVLVFIAAVVGPWMVAVTEAAGLISPAGTFDRKVAGAIFPGISGPLYLLTALLAVMLVAGAYRLTEAGRTEGISDELRAATRLSTVAHLVALAILTTATVREDRIGLQFFEQASDLARNTAHALLALAAARHFAQAGLGGAARGGRWLAAASLVVIVARYALTRTTHDDMFNTVQPRYAYLVPPINLVLWTGKLVIFGMLCRVLRKTRAMNLAAPARPS